MPEPQIAFIAAEKTHTHIFRRATSAKYALAWKDIMKVKIEIDTGLEETEVIIRCKSLNDSIVNLQKNITDSTDGSRCITLHAGDTQYYVPIEDVYFFETEGREILAHTADKIFTSEFKLYELERMLPGNFMRISKSTIVNIDYIYSITRNLTASSTVEFVRSSKKTLVSRAYYKSLTERISLRRTSKNKEVCKMV